MELELDVVVLMVVLLACSGRLGTATETQNGCRSARPMLAVERGAAWRTGAQGAVVLIQLFS
jgi:hypothetical protein